MEIRQVIALAVQKEEAAAELYGRMAREADDPAVRALLEDLDADERRHQQVLLGIDPAKIPAFAEGELRAPRLAEFLQVRPVSPASRLQDVLVYAIRREREATAFYSDMAERVHDGVLRDVFEGLAAMENGHLVRLEDLYESTFMSEY
jgi:rubrerythrin